MPLPEAKPESKPRRTKAPKTKIDPKLVTAARELRDRYLEQMNHDHLLGQGKYEVSRQLPSPQAVHANDSRLLAA